MFDSIDDTVLVKKIIISVSATMYVRVCVCVRVHACVCVRACTSICLSVVSVRMCSERSS